MSAEPWSQPPIGGEARADSIAFPSLAGLDDRIKTHMAPVFTLGVVVLGDTVVKRRGASPQRGSPMSKRVVSSMVSPNHVLIPALRSPM